MILEIRFFSIDISDPVAWEYCPIYTANIKLPVIVIRNQENVFSIQYVDCNAILQYKLGRLSNHYQLILKSRWRFGDYRQDYLVSSALLTVTLVQSKNKLTTNKHVTKSYSEAFHLCVNETE